MAHPLEALLEVQDHDVRADQLRHRRSHLPERLALAQAEQSLAAVMQEAQEVGEREAELARSQRRLEDEVASLQARAAEVDARLYSGTVTAPRELSWMQEEVQGTRRRQRHLEDEVLALMEVVEPLTARLGHLDSERQALEAEAESHRSAILAAEAELVAELEEVTAARASAASGVGGDLLSTYEALRDRLGGVGVARLDHGRCSGCHLSLPATELDGLRRAPHDALTRHEECGRILVR